MTQSTDNEIKYIRDLLIEIKSEIKDVKKDTASLDTRLAKLEGVIEQQQSYVSKIPDLAEKVGELKNWRQIALVIITGTASTVFGWFLRSGRT